MENIPLELFIDMCGYLSDMCVCVRAHMFLPGLHLSFILLF